MVLLISNRRNSIGKHFYHQCTHVTMTKIGHFHRVSHLLKLRAIRCEVHSQQNTHTQARENTMLYVGNENVFSAQ